MDIHLAADAGNFNLFDDTRLIVRDASSMVSLKSGIEIWLTSGEAYVEKSVDGWKLTRFGSVDSPELVLEILRRVDHIMLTAHLRNTTDHPILVASLSPIAAPTLGLGGAIGDWSFYRVGWQSWSPAGATRVGTDRLPATPPIVAPITPRVGEGDLMSPWGAIVRGSSEECALLVGFTTAVSQSGTISLSQSGELRATCDLEDMILDPGQTILSESLFMACGVDADALLQIYGREIGAAMRARLSARSISGWCTWYQYFSDVSESDVLENLEYLVSEGLMGEIQVVQLDDGYESEFGDWLSINKKFAHGMKWLADQIRAAGFTPGLWLAPFTVSPKSQLYAEHPDWIIRNGSDEPLQAWREFDWDVELYGIDCSNPAVLDWLEHVFRTVVHEWGFEYLKLDFLFCGALRGQRHKIGITAMEAYRSGLSLIREVVGDAFILGCGAPLLPSVGLVDAMRIGPDIAPFWKPDIRDVFRVWPSAENAARNVLARYWMHDTLWQNDPDCLLLRDTDTDLTEAEVQTWVTLVGMSGGVVMWSDALGLLSQGRDRLIDILLPVFGYAARPEALLDAEKPQKLVLTVERPFGSWCIVALFNWDDATRIVEYYLPDKKHVYEFWTQTYHGLVQGRIRLQIPPHGCRLLSLRPTADRPQLVGSTFHFTQGGVEVTEKQWNQKRRSLMLQLRVPGQRQGRLVFTWPSEYRLRNIESGLAEARTKIEDNLLELDGVLLGKTEITLRFTSHRNSR